MYHVNADNSFPYRVCGGQQESGSACVSSRGNDGMITFREWHPVGVEEYGFAVPDPLNDNIIYGGKITRYDRRVSQVQNIAPTPVRPADFRTLRTAPVAFSVVDPHVMYFASNTLWKTATGGRSWQKIGPDLTRKTWEPPATIGIFRSADTAKSTQRGVIYTVAPSPLDVNRIWIGTDDGLVQATADGGASFRRDVTPPDLKLVRPKVSIIDAGHFDGQTAIRTAVNLHCASTTCGRTSTARHDGGTTWTAITNGLPDNAFGRRGPRGSETEKVTCYYAGYRSGADSRLVRRWRPLAQSLRSINMPGDYSIRRRHREKRRSRSRTARMACWHLDPGFDITPLHGRWRSELRAAPPVWLFKPQVAYRVRQNTNTDTPIPPDESSGTNPPDGAIINYALASAASSPVTLEILDAAGTSIRRYSSADRIENPDASNAPVPLYWYRPVQNLSAAAGMHRFLWDVHYQPLPGGGGGRGGLPIAAVPHDTVPVPSGPWAPPGSYSVRLTVDGKTYSQPLTLKMDPRVKTPPLGLTQQFTLSKRLYDDILSTRW